MPPKPKQPPKKRVRPTVTVTLDPESLAVVDARMAERPDLWSRSAAIRDLIQVAAEALESRT